MNSSTKVFAILALTTSMGQLIAKTQAEDKTQAELDAIHYRGQKLYEAGFLAAQKYPFAPLKEGKQKQIGKKIDEVCKDGESFTMLKTLAFLTCGLNDIWSNIGPDKKAPLESVFKRIVWAQKVFDPKLNQHEVYNAGHAKYESWVS